MAQRGRALDDMTMLRILDLSGSLRQPPDDPGGRA
jgi:hypothetical protein